MFDKVFVECVHIAAHTEVITVITVVLTCNMVRRGPWELGTATTAPTIPSILTQKKHILWPKKHKLCKYKTKMSWAHGYALSYDDCCVTETYALKNRWFLRGENSKMGLGRRKTQIHLLQSLVVVVMLPSIHNWKTILSIICFTITTIILPTNQFSLRGRQLLLETILKLVSNTNSAACQHTNLNPVFDVDRQNNA